eukprot:UN02698
MNTIPSISLTNTVISNHVPDNRLQNKFISRVLSLQQTSPRKINYTIYVKIAINPTAETKEVFFSYQPDTESLASVINEMIDALQLNKDFHFKIIIQSIQNAMKTKQMKIVPTPCVKPKILTKSNFNNINNNLHTDENHEIAFLPLSPLILSPRILHKRPSNATFPDLRSSSMSESDLFSLINAKPITHNSNKYGDELFDYSDTL